MSFSYLNPEVLAFPLIEENDDELVAMGGELSSEWLLLAYRSGIFPWFSSDEQPICWYSFNPRLLLFPDQLHISQSMAKLLKNPPFKVKLDYNFEAMISLCGSVRQQSGTWITHQMIKAYTELHKMGYAHSVEVYNNQNVLVGGFYGLRVGSIFCGESMVSIESNASKYALIQFINYFKNKGLTFIDCQQVTPHLTSMGGLAYSRKDFLSLLYKHRNDDDGRGNWQNMFPNFGLS